MSHCGCKAPDAAVAGGNLTGLRRNMAAMLMCFVKINYPVSLDVEKVLEDSKMISQKKEIKLLHS